MTLFGSPIPGEKQGKVMTIALVLHRYSLEWAQPCSVVHGASSLVTEAGQQHG